MTRRERSLLQMAIAYTRWKCMCYTPEANTCNDVTFAPLRNKALRQTSGATADHQLGL